MIDLSLTPSERVVRIMRDLQLSPGHHFLGGSGVLALRDIRHVGDLDIGVTTRYWWSLHAMGGWEIVTPNPDDEWECCDPPYLRRNVRDTEVHVFYAWRWRGEHETPFNAFALVLRDGLEVVLGIPCIKLPILLRQKVDAVVNGMYGNMREKDVTDIRLIAEYMESL